MLLLFAKEKNSVIDVETLFGLLLNHTDSKNERFQ